jgi:type IX secretion system PorP/SprF family membrane protein
MNLLFRKALGLVLFCLIQRLIFCQDAQVAHGLGTVMYNNPAMTGAFMRPSFYSTYRNQWPEISGGFITFHTGADAHLDAVHGGLGVRYMFNNDGLGTLITQNIGLSYAFRANLTEKAALRMGIGISHLQYTIDWGKLNFGDQIDPLYGFIYEQNAILGPTHRRLIKTDLGLALLHQRYLISYAALNANQPDRGFSGVSILPIRHYVQAALLAKLGDNNGLVFDATYQRQQMFNQLLLKANYYNRYMRIGTGIRNRDAVIGMIGGQLRQFRFSYIYEMTISKLTNAKSGSHEVQFTWSLQSAKGMDRECPAVLWNGF